MCDLEENVQMVVLPVPVTLSMVDGVPTQWTASSWMLSGFLRTVGVPTHPDKWRVFRHTPDLCLVLGAALKCKEICRSEQNAQPPTPINLPEMGMILKKQIQNKSLTVLSRSTNDCQDIECFLKSN